MISSPVRMETEVKPETKMEEIAPSPENRMSSISQADILRAATSVFAAPIPNEGKISTLLSEDSSSIPSFEITQQSSITAAIPVNVSGDSKEDDLSKYTNVISMDSRDVASISRIHDIAPSAEPESHLSISDLNNNNNNGEQQQNISQEEIDILNVEDKSEIPSNIVETVPQRMSPVNDDMDNYGEQDLDFNESSISRKESGVNSGSSSANASGSESSGYNVRQRRAASASYNGSSNSSYCKTSRRYSESEYGRQPSYSGENSNYEDSDYGDEYDNGIRPGAKRTSSMPVLPRAHPTSAKYHPSLPTQRSPTTGEFSCPSCNLTFSRRYNLQTHFTAHHLKLKPYVCVCGRGFSRRYDLGRHRAVRGCSGKPYNDGDSQMSGSQADEQMSWGSQSDNESISSIHSATVGASLHEKGASLKRRSQSLSQTSQSLDHMHAGGSLSSSQSSSSSQLNVLAEGETGSNSLKINTGSQDSSRPNSAASRRNGRSSSVSSSSLPTPVPEGEVVSSKKSGGRAVSRKRGSRSTSFSNGAASASGRKRKDSNAPLPTGRGLSSNKSNFTIYEDQATNGTKMSANGFVTPVTPGDQDNEDRSNLDYYGNFEGYNGVPAHPRRYSSPSYFSGYDRQERDEPAAAYYYDHYRNQYGPYCGGYTSPYEHPSMMGPPGSRSGSSPYSLPPPYVKDGKMAPYSQQPYYSGPQQPQQPPASNGRRYSNDFNGGNAGYYTPTIYPPAEYGDNSSGYAGERPAKSGPTASDKMRSSTTISQAAFVPTVNCDGTEITNSSSQQKESQATQQQLAEPSTVKESSVDKSGPANTFVSYRETVPRRGFYRYSAMDDNVAPNETNVNKINGEETSSSTANAELAKSQEEPRIMVTSFEKSVSASHTDISNSPSPLGSHQNVPTTSMPSSQSSSTSDTSKSNEEDIGEALVLTRFLMKVKQQTEEKQTLAPPVPREPSTSSLEDSVANALSQVSKGSYLKRRESYSSPSTTSRDDIFGSIELEKENEGNSDKRRPRRTSFVITNEMERKQVRRKLSEMSAQQVAAAAAAAVYASPMKRRKAMSFGTPTH